MVEYPFVIISFRGPWAAWGGPWGGPWVPQGFLGLLRMHELHDCTNHVCFAVLPFQRCISSPRCHSCSTRRRYLLSILCVRKSCLYLYGSVSGHQSTPDTQFGETAAELDSDHSQLCSSVRSRQHSARLWEQATCSSAAL